MSLRLNLDILLQTHFQLHLWRRSLFHLHLHWGSCHVASYPSQNPWCFDSFFFFLHFTCNLSTCMWAKPVCEYSREVQKSNISYPLHCCHPGASHHCLLPGPLIATAFPLVPQPSHCPAKSILCRQRDPIKSSGSSLASRFCSESFYVTQSRSQKSLPL